MDTKVSATDVPRTKDLRRQSMPPASARRQPINSNSNRVYDKPASPEVISSLISSLSIISTPVNELFEQSSEDLLAQASQFHAPYEYSGKSKRASTGGSFGVDYGAYTQWATQDSLSGINSFDDLPASPPTIRTAKPPSGYSSLTAPKSPTASFRSFLRSGSRPSSKGSVQEIDDNSSIGNLSVEPGLTTISTVLRSKSSAESWDKRQARNQKGLMYMSSKEQLRESEKKRPKALGLLPMPTDTDTFMASTPIREESPYEFGPDNAPTRTTTLQLPDKYKNGAISPALSTHSGGVGSGRFIPSRRSSLHAKPSTARRRSSQRPSQRSSRHEEDWRLSGADSDRLSMPRSLRSTEVKDGVDPDPSSALSSSSPDPLSQSDSATTTLPCEQIPQPVMVEDYVVPDTEVAPAPAIGKTRTSFEGVEAGKAQNPGVRSGPGIAFQDTNLPKRENSRLKRLSVPSNVSRLSSDRPAQTLSARKDTVSPEPGRASIRLEDRPGTADSIDDSVESYLAAPRLSQRIQHPQTRRKISFSEVGDPEGFAVFCCVGMGLTRYITAFYDELALTLKLRLITPDRPGVGDSEAYTDGYDSPLNWPDDVYTICQSLKITKFSILAHSAGAIYALATALRMPQHIRGRIHLLAPWIPPSQLNTVGGKDMLPAPSKSIPTSQRILRALPTPILKAANSSFMSATSSSLTSSLPKSPRRSKRRSTSGRDTPTISVRNAVPGPDKENVRPEVGDYPKPLNTSALALAMNDASDPNHNVALQAAALHSTAERERQIAYDTRLTHAIWDLATSGANPAVDLLVCLERRHTIGFRYVDITRAVVIHHGSKDSRVPVENVKWLGRMMRRCEVRILDGEGHGLMASASVMGGVLMEISREWEDWMSVVNQKPSTTSDTKPRTLRERASLGTFR